MPLHETLARFSDIVRSYEVLQYEVEGLHARLKLRVVFLDESQLYVMVPNATTIEEALVGSRAQLQKP